MVKQREGTIEFLLSLSPTLSINRIKKDNQVNGWTLSKSEPFYTLDHYTTGCRVIISSEFTDIIHQSTCILGLAGTANEQAIEIGKTVFCFEGFGPQSTRLRFEEQSKLLGKNLHFISNRETAYIAKTLITSLKTVKKITTPPRTTSAAKHIINAILSHFSGQSK